MEERDSSVSQWDNACHWQYRSRGGEEGMPRVLAREATRAARMLGLIAGKGREGDEGKGRGRKGTKEDENTADFFCTAAICRVRISPRER